MSWRTVVISQNAKLDYQLGYLVVRGRDTVKIHIGEIGCVIVESTAVSMTAYLLSELVKRKIKVIFCDEKRNPSSELIPYYGSHDTSSKVKKQIEWNGSHKTLIWTEIISEKIRQQIFFLEILKRPEADVLKRYLSEIEPGDTTNREGHAAKIYFEALFGKDFTRAKETPVNAALNYGYTVILSCFNREICANGYITQLGLSHDNMFNQFNLSCDFMEPFRILVDMHVVYMKPEKFETEEKHDMLNILQKSVVIDGRQENVTNAIKIYVRSLFDAINENDISQIRFYRNEL